MSSKINSYMKRKDTDRKDKASNPKSKKPENPPDSKNNPVSPIHNGETSNQSGIERLLKEIMEGVQKEPLRERPHAIDDDATCSALNSKITEYLDSYILIGYDAYNGRRLTICNTKTHKERDAIIEAVKNTLYMMLGQEMD